MKKYYTQERLSYPPETIFKKINTPLFKKTKYKLYTYPHS